MVAVGDDQRQTSRHVASNEQDWRERLALVNPLEILVHVGFVAWEKRQLGGAQKVLRSVIDELRLLKARYQRFGLRIRKEQRKKIHCSIEVRGLPLLRPFELRFGHAPAPFLILTPGCSPFVNSTPAASKADRIDRPEQSGALLTRSCGSPPLVDGADQVAFGCVFLGANRPVGEVFFPAARDKSAAQNSHLASAGLLRSRYDLVWRPD
jgi:hypothetical protein